MRPRFCEVCFYVKEAPNFEKKVQTRKRWRFIPKGNPLSAPRFYFEKKVQAGKRWRFIIKANLLSAPRFYERYAHEFEALKLKPCERNIMHILAFILQTDL